MTASRFLDTLAAMRLIVLASLFAATLCADSTTSTTSATVSEPTTSAGHLRNTTVTEAISSTTKIATNTPQHETTTAHAEVSSKNVSAATPPSSSLQTLNGTEETHVSHTPGTTTNNQTSTKTVSHRVTFTPASESPNVTAVMINTTGTAFPQQWGKGDLAGNPGLVAILFIFCVTLVLVLVVAMVKCIQSPRSNFKSLEDVPMGNVGEKSPFAQYSK